MRAIEKHHSTSWLAAPNVRWSSEFLGFLLLGLCFSYLIYPAFERFGLLRVVLVVLAVPVVTAVAVFAIPHLLSGVKSTREKFTWWHWLFLLLFIGSENFRVRGPNQARSEPLDAWAALRIFPEVIVVLLLAFRVASRKSSLNRMFTGLPGALVLFSLICVASASWSVYPGWTLYKSMEYLMDVTVLVVILDALHTAEDYVTVLNWTWTLYALEVLTAWVGAVLWPADAWDYEGRLQSLHPMVGGNIIGATGAAMALVAISRLLRIDEKRPERTWYGAVLIFGIASMMAAQTRNALGGFVFAAPLVLMLAKRKWIVVALGTVSTAVFMLTSASNVVWTYLQRGQTDEVFRSGTGRFIWWKAAWGELLQHPLTGLGAFAGGKFGVLPKLSQVNALNTPYLHSDWADIAVGTSFWGFTVFLAAVLGTWWLLLKYIRTPLFSSFERQLAIEAIGVLALLSVHSLFNNSLSEHPPFMFLAVLGYAELLRRKVKRQRYSPMRGMAHAENDLVITPIRSFG